MFDVTDEQENVAHWGAELGNAHQLSAAGFSKDVMKPGDKVSITGHPSRSGAPRIQFHHPLFTDGSMLTMGGIKGNGEHADTEDEAIVQRQIRQDYLHHFTPHITKIGSRSGSE